MKISRFTLPLILLATAVVSESQAQFGSSYGAMGYHGDRGRDFSHYMDQAEAPEIDMVAMTGLFDIDSRDAVKRAKVSDEAVQREIHKAIAAYVMAMGDVMIIHAADIAVVEQGEELVNETNKQAQEGQEIDRAAMQNLMSKTREKMAAIRLAMAPIHEEMNSRVERAIGDNGKQLKKWRSFYNTICNEHRFNRNMPQHQ